MNEVPRCASAAARVFVMCWMSWSMVRATKVAWDPRANCASSKGRSMEPMGVDFFFVPTGDVGEYRPFVRP